MSIAGAHATQFFEEIVATGNVWSVRDDAGFPTSTNASGEAAMPFWSSERRALKIIAGVAAYQNFVPARLALDTFRSRWLPGLERDGLRVGINWSGDRATGYDMVPRDVIARLDITP
jgi:hypothetical protein